MPLELKIVSEHAVIVGDDATRVFSEDGGSIGRSLENDWILPDPDRYISGRHAVIDYRGGIYNLVDLSTNGIYLNDEHEPIGKGNMRRLFNGDRLRMGDFEILVHLDKGESLAMPLDEDDNELPEDIEMLVPEVTLKTGMELLGEEEITGDDEFQSVLFSTTRMDKPESAEPAPAAAKPAPKERVLASKRDESSQEELFDIFLKGLGMNRSDLHPSVDPQEVMQNAGEVLREFVDGTSKLLASRTNLKSAFSLDQTSVLPRGNNPLKLSQNTQGSIKQLLVGREGEYLGPRNSVKEVCRDLLFHQDAFLDAMSDAFVEFADRFDPDELRAGFDANSKPLPLFGFLNKMRYWDQYCDLYPAMTEKSGGRIPGMFAEEFVRSYNRQIAEFKRIELPVLRNPVPVLKPLAEEEPQQHAVKTINTKSPLAFDENFVDDANDFDEFDDLDDEPSADLAGR